MRTRSCTGPHGGRNGTVSRKNVTGNVARLNGHGDVGANQRRCSIKAIEVDLPDREAANFIC